MNPGARKRVRMMGELEGKGIERNASILITSKRNPQKEDAKSVCLHK